MSLISRMSLEQGHFVSQLLDAQVLLLQGSFVLTLQFLVLSDLLSSMLDFLILLPDTRHQLTGQLA